MLAVLGGLGGPVLVPWWSVALVVRSWCLGGLRGLGGPGGLGGDCGSLLLVVLGLLVALVVLVVRSWWSPWPW